MLYDCLLILINVSQYLLNYTGTLIDIGGVQQQFYKTQIHKISHKGS